LTVLERSGEYVGQGVQREARLRLWEMTGDRTHLEDAYRLLCLALGTAPAEHHEAMFDKVALHRESMEAWEEHGGGVGK